MKPRFSFYLIILLTTLLPRLVWGQCPTGTVTLTTQAEVDAFPPGCVNLPGNLFIQGADITNLGSLSALQSIAGILGIRSNAQLSSLSGLDNLTSIGDDLLITNNAKLSSLSALNNLTNIDRDLNITNNASLSSLNGLNNAKGVYSSLTIMNNARLSDMSALSKLDGNYYSLEITNNDALTNLNGFNNLTQTRALLAINDNDALTDLSALSNMRLARSLLEIINNDALVSLNGLQTLTEVGRTFTISGNAKLSDMSALTRLTTIKKDLIIDNNSALSNLNGLNNLSRVGDLLGDGDLFITNNEKLTDISALTKQTILSDKLIIEGNPVLTNLNGLNNVTTIIGGASIKNNERLNDLSALTNLTTIRRGRFIIEGNPALTNLNGLNNLTGIESLEIKKNESLTSLSALTSLTAIGGLTIEANPVLTNLNGLTNLTSIQYGLRIVDNPQLSACAIAPICQYLTNPPGEVTISGNATGCASPNEIRADCVPLAITTQPNASLTVDVGSTVTVPVSTSGNVRSYRWYLGDQVVSGQTSATLALSSVRSQDAGVYRVVVANSVSSLTSTAFNLTVNPPPVPIHTIQGSAHVSPLVGQMVTTTAIVTVVRTSGGRGFYMQDTNPDADEATAEGLFVSTNTAPTLRLGDAVQVRGTVTEVRSGGSSSNQLTVTQITSSTVVVLSRDNPLPGVTVLGRGGRPIPTGLIEDDANGDIETSNVFDPATDAIDFYESLEGMLVQINTPVVINPTNNFGETWVVADNGATASLRTPRGGIVGQVNDFNPERIKIDDVLVPISNINVGTQLSSLVGVLDYSAGNYAVLPTTSPTVEVPSTLTKEVTSLTGSARTLTVATFNANNLDPGDGATKFNNLASAIVNNLKSPDVVVIEEMQDNNGPTNDGLVDASTTFQTLINAIAAAGGPTYQFRQIDPVTNQDGGEPGGNIRQGFLFNPNRVQFTDIPGGTSSSSTTVNNAGGVAQLSASPGRIDPTNPAFSSSRKPLVGAFVFGGQTIIIIGNHFVNKAGDQPLFGRFQPPALLSEAQRNQQATVVKDFVQRILAIDPNANVAVVGDLNDFEYANPLNILKSSGLNPLVETLPANERYTYSLDGNAQALDHILVSNSLLSQLKGFDVVHINTEFVDRLSDHDPSVALFNLAPALSATLVASSSAVCPSTPISLSLTVAGLIAGQTYSYTISNGTNTTTASGLSATSVQASVIPTVPGAFTATVLTSSNLSTTATSGPATIKPTPPTPSLTTQTGQLYPGGQAAVSVPQYSGMVTLLVSGCTGTLNWQGPNGTSGTTTSIPVATSVTGTFVYQATCQLNGCTSAPGSATITVQAAALAMMAPLYDCASRKLTLRTTGGNGQPFEYHIASVTTGWETVSATFTVQDKHIGKSLKLRARQRSSPSGGYVEVETSFTPTACGARQAVSQEPLAPLSVAVLGNPVVGEAVEVEVRGADGQPLRLQLSNLSGQAISERVIEQASAIERQNFSLNQQSAGLLLLRVSTPTQSQTVKLIKAH